MFTVRQEVITALGEVALQTFTDRMLDHLGVQFPDRVAALQLEGTRDAIRHGVRRARGHGLVSERDMREYLETMFAFGRDFDVDATLPWAGAILTDPLVPDPSVRAGRLVAAAKANLVAARGITGE